MTVIVAYAPTDVADEDAKDAFFDQLHQAVGQASPHDITIILTDANATLSSSDRSTGSPVGTTFADRSTNDNGNRLLLLCHHNNLCIADTWFPRKLIHHWTWYSPDGRTRKAMDHILISRRWKPFVTNCHVYRGAELGNKYHRLLVAQLKLKLRANQHTKTQPRLDSSLLSDPNIATDFSCTIRRTFDNLATEKVNNWQTFKESVIQSAHNVFGCFRPSPKKPWISERTLNIIDWRREARLRGDLTEYQRLNRQCNVAIAEDREKFWQAEAKHLESAANNNNMSRVFSLLRQARNGPRIKTALVKDSDGNLIATEANCLELWKEHFSLLLQHGTSPADPAISSATNAAAPSAVCSTDPVTPEEVRAALEKLNNRKAPSIFAITAEMLKLGGESIVEWLTHIFNEVWETERLPSDWTRGVILPFWKHLKAAFDTVCHTSLWSILHALGAPPKIVALFKLLYSNAQSCVRINGRDSDWFPISSGVRQGCVAAPDLFNCIIDHLMSRVCERVPGVSFGSYHLTDLEYADDTILLSTSYSQLRDALGIYSEEAEKLGLQVSWTKTKFMYVGDRPHPPSLRLGNNIVEPVKNFVYLGSIVTDNRDLKPEITRRRALAASALQSL
ncbi:unnamed protein product [Leuciscus chuanchicus]